MKVAVIGAGTAGAAAALFLARSGHAVTVFERVPSPGPVGAGIVLQPTGQAVLARLGLLSHALERGARIDTLRATTSAGRQLFELSYRDVDARLFGLGLHRGVLFEALHEAVSGDARITLHTGVDVVGCRRRHERRLVVDAHGEEYGPFELVVVSDGAGSRIADACVSRRVSSYPWGAFWAVLPDPQDVFAGVLSQVVENAQRMVGFLPTGRRPTKLRAAGLAREDRNPSGRVALASTDRDTDADSDTATDADSATRTDRRGRTPDGQNVVSLFWSVRRDEVSRLRAAGIARFREEVLRLEPRAEAVLSPLATTDLLLFAGYHDVVMPRWHGERIVWLGDAAHAMSPQLGQGANLALWDAMALADAIDEAENSGRDVGAALASYSDGRRDHLDFYQFATRWLTPFFQSDVTLFGFLRDVLMPAATRVPLLRRRMVRSMAGVERGIVRAPLSLALA